MPLEISIDVNDQVSPTLRKLLSGLSGEGLRELNEVVARDGVSFLKEYHQGFETAGGWTNPSLPTHGAGRQKSRFGEDVARAWQVGSVSGDGFTLTNNATGFAHKVDGGTISAKKAKALTIPMVPEAHGVRARDYAGKLFRPKGKDYLMENLSNGEARVVYLLRKSVTHKAVDGALPADEELGSRLVSSMSKILLEELD